MFEPMPAHSPTEQTDAGEFQRQEDAFREWISNDGSTPYPAATARYHLTVPVLWDKKAKKIVNNCEDDICRMFNNVFNKFAKNKDVDLFPKDIAAEHDKLCDFLYENVNNGVYRAGFATRQRPYESSCKKLFDALDQLE